MNPEKPIRKNMKPAQRPDQRQKLGVGGSRQQEVNKVPGMATRLAAANMLTQIVDHKASMDDLVDPLRGHFEFLKLEARDQQLAKAILLTTLRQKNRIDHVLKKCWNRKPPQKARFLIHILETAAAQILFMDVPQSAAVNLAVSAVRNDNRTTRFASFTNAVLRGLSRDKDMLLEKSAGFSIFPDWMQKMLGRDFGKDKTLRMSAAVMLEPNLDLQAKPGASIDEEEMIALPGDGKRLLSNAMVQDLPGYDEGNWWIQDIAAAQPVRLLGDVRGKEVADLCAAPGGKTMQLAALGAKVTAVDISHRRLKRLEENLARTRLVADIVEADITTWQPNKLFDAVLLDAPCSATGTLRRHPDILWNTTPEDLTILAALQRQLIANAAKWVKPGGILVYANCSLFKEEGENLVSTLNLPNLRLDPILPAELPELEYCINGQNIFRALPYYLELQPPEKSGMDGFFAARFIVEN